MPDPRLCRWSRQFNAKATARGSSVISCDPLYRYHVAEIRERIDVTFQRVLEETSRNADEFVWSDDLPDVAALGRRRMAAMRAFLDDFAAGKVEGRYIAAALPNLPFADGAFELAVCSHYLFLYSELLAEDFHVASLRELCRVSAEVRVFPLLELGGLPSRHLVSVVERLREVGYTVNVEEVDYEFQRGGNQLLRMRR